MATAREFIEAASAHIGYTENPPGSNRTIFAQPAGHTNGYPWCSTFLVALARTLDLPLPSESAYTPAMWNGFKAARQTTKDPQPGDFAFFNFPGDGKDRVQHVGVVTAVTATTVTCIEGNTSSATRGSQDNGGGVYRRTRPRSHVVGYGRPAYTPTPAKRYAMLIYVRRGTVDTQAALTAHAVAPHGVVTLSLIEAENALQRGEKVIAVGGPACDDLNGSKATMVRGKTAVETAQKILAMAANGWQ